MQLSFTAPFDLSASTLVAIKTCGCDVASAFSVGGEGVVVVGGWVTRPKLFFFSPRRFRGSLVQQLGCIEPNGGDEEMRRIPARWLLLLGGGKVLGGGIVGLAVAVPTLNASPPPAA